MRLKQTPKRTPTFCKNLPKKRQQQECTQFAVVCRHTYDTIQTFLSSKDLVHLHQVNRTHADRMHSLLIRIRYYQHLVASLAHSFRTSNYAEFQERLQYIRQMMIGKGGRYVFRCLALSHLLQDMLMQIVIHPTVWETSQCGYLDERYMYELAICGVSVSSRKRNTLSPWGAFVYTHIYLPIKEVVDGVIRLRARQHHHIFECVPDILQQFRQNNEFRRLVPGFVPVDK